MVSGHSNCSAHVVDMLFLLLMLAVYAVYADSNRTAMAIVGVWKLLQCTGLSFDDMLSGVTDPICTVSLRYERTTQHSLLQPSKGILISDWRPYFRDWKSLYVERILSAKTCTDTYFTQEKEQFTGEVLIPSFL